MARVLEPWEVEVDCGLVANVASCCEDTGLDQPAQDPAEQAQRDAAFSMAREALNLLTAGLVANCPVVVRPCSPGCCVESEWALWSGLRWTPRIVGPGLWINACGCDDPCGCTRKNGLDLGEPIAEVLNVSVDGTVLDPADYALVDYRWLYRLGPVKDWPTVQDLDLMPTEPGTFAVQMRPGYPLGTAGERALGRLVCEYLKAVCGKKCSLPKNVVQIVRQGVTMEMRTGLFPENSTGIDEVDLYVASLNPYGLKTVPTVTSPDVSRRRGW